jgi:hypothetical protein
MLNIMCYLLLWSVLWEFDLYLVLHKMPHRVIIRIHISLSISCIVLFDVYVCKRHKCCGSAQDQAVVMSGSILASRGG